MIYTGRQFPPCGACVRLQKNQKTRH